jgi:hypothetical protein
MDYADFRTVGKAVTLRCFRREIDPLPNRSDGAAPRPLRRPMGPQLT